MTPRRPRVQNLAWHARPLLAASLAAFAFAACRAPQSSLTPREEATVYLARNEPEKAIPLLEELHQKSPDDLSIARALVEAHVKAGRVTPLIDRLKADAREGPVRHYMLGLAFFSRAADAQGPAIDELRRAAQLEPDEAELHYRLGLALLESERFEEALAALERAKTLAPGQRSYALPLAKAYHRTGSSARAVEALRDVVAGEPSPAEVKTARLLMDQISDPFARLPQAARPKLEQGLSWLFDRDVPQQAIVTFEEMLRDWPDVAVVHALLGLAYQRVDDAGRAVDELRRAVELAPDDGKNHLYLGRLYLSHQRPKQAQEHLARAVELNPLLDDAHEALGDLAAEASDFEAASRHFRTLTFLRPDSADARGKLAAVRLRLGDFAGASRELERVLSREPDNVEFKLKLGLVRAEQSRTARTIEERSACRRDARKLLEEVLEAQPENALASQALEGLK